MLPFYSMFKQPVWPLLIEFFLRCIVKSYSTTLNPQIVSDTKHHKPYTPPRAPPPSSPTWYYSHCLRCLVSLVAHPHLLVWATNKQFLPATATFRAYFANETTAGCNKCWHSPFAGGMHPFVWVGYYLFGVAQCYTFWPSKDVQFAYPGQTTNSTRPNVSLLVKEDEDLS